MSLRDACLLIVLCLAVFLPGTGTIPTLDRDESRFAQASKQMLETGDWVDIRFQDVPRHKKPAGAYWAQAGSVTAFSPDDRGAVWAYRLPSVIAATLAVLFTAAAAALLFGPGHGLVAGALLATSVSLVVEAHQAKADALLLATVAAAQFALARIRTGWERGEVRSPLWTSTLLWLAVGAGILVKGPITPLVVLATAAALSIWTREARWLLSLRPVTGIVLAGLVAAPWFIAIQSQTGGDFLQSSVGKDLLPKLIGGQESHGAPPGYYILLLTVTFWPASLFVWPALVRGWRSRTEPAVRFLICWIVPIWLMFELVPTKLPHYVLPTYPALAILVAAMLVPFLNGASQPDYFGRRWAKGLLVGLWTLIGISLAVAAPVAMMRFGPVDGPGLVIMAGALLLAVLVLGTAREALRETWRCALFAAVAAGVVAYGLVLGFVLPSLERLVLAPRLAALVSTHLDQVGQPLPIYATGYREPSLVFAIGTDLQLATPDEIAATLPSGGALALVEDRNREAFLGAIAGAGRSAEDVSVPGPVTGLNYSNGREVTVRLYRIK